MKLKILITGSSGLLGKALQSILSQDVTLECIYTTSKDCDLRNYTNTILLFEQHLPDIVIHCAACVGGVYENMNNNYKFLIDNMNINNNIIECCKNFNVKKCINILSTCIFPDKGVNYPLSSDQLHNGLPHESNIGYAYAKRLLHVAGKILASSSNTQVVNIIPTNLYGKNDNYNLQSSHVIPALIHKVYLSQQSNSKLELFGTGKAIRQFLYADDLARIIHKFVVLDQSEEKCITCIASPPSTDEISIYDLSKKIVDIFEFKGEIECNTSYSDGQYKKTTNDNELKKYIKDFEFISLNEGLKDTIEYFKLNYKSLRI
jgi:GDP-L-fucose synthase